MRQLEPDAGEGIGELVRVLKEAARNFFIRRVDAQREVGRQHRRRRAFAAVVCHRHRAGTHAMLWLPLVGSGRTLVQLPLVAEQVPEEVVAPSGWRRGPCHFEAAGDCIGTFAAAAAADPAKALVFDGGCFRFRAYVRSRAGAMCLAEGVTTGDQGNRLFVVHRHAREGFADVFRGRQRIRVAVGAFRVHIDQAHLHRRQWIFQIALAAVALVIKPGFFHAPVNIELRLPDVFATAGKTESLEAHGFQRHIAGEDHQVGPRDPAAVFLFDRPQKAAGFVEVAVIRPAVERSEALVASAGAAAAVTNAVGAGAVPGHANEEGAIVTKVGRPPVLRRRHQRGKVLLQRGVIERVEFVCVIEVSPHGVRLGGLLVQDVELQLVGPPVLVRGALTGSVVEWTLAVSHGLFPVLR